MTALLRCRNLNNMHPIQDLHFEKEFVPLLDSVGCEPSRDRLFELLSEFPVNLAGVLARQDMLKTLLQHPHLLHPLFYGRSEFHDLSVYFAELRARDTAEDAGAIRRRLFFASTNRQRERGRLMSLFIFLDRIRQIWIQPLNDSSLLYELQDCIWIMRTTIQELEVEKYQAIGRRRGFTLQEIVRCLVRINEQIRTGKMDAFWRSFHEFEAWTSVARGISKHRWVFPVMGMERISIRQLYHPLLKNPVKNDLLIGDQVLLLTGPNMSGKSTLLKSVGLCVVLASLGLAVPAEHCELPFFDTISIAIDLHDDLRSGYSHFMQELMTLKRVVSAAGEGKTCFAVFDELFRGTNPDDALAISRTTIEGLTRFTGSFFLISTHLQQLQEMLSLQSIATHYIECILENERPRFTYRLMEGWSDCHIGRLLFEKEGLNGLLGFSDH